MPTPQHLQQRFVAIADSLQRSGRAEALLGLGSAGLETDRMDAYSDLDFFAIVKPGEKQAFIDDLSWLSDLHPVGYAFRNTVDGYKLLFADGVFCEFAVFEAAELATIPYAEGKLIWAEDGFDAEQLKPQRTDGRYQRSDDSEWILGEALTNLYVGLGRYRRGEKLSAFKFVQSFALDRLIDLVYLTQQKNSVVEDVYMPDRRLEARFSGIESVLSECLLGYQQTPQSALAQLSWLEAHFTVNPSIAGEIRRLATL